MSKTSERCSISPFPSLEHFMGTQKISWSASRCALRRLARLRGLAVAACGGHACGAGPNFGPVGPPLRIPRSGRSGPLWVPLCSGRSGRGLWVCSVGRAGRPGLLPKMVTEDAAAQSESESTGMLIGTEVGARFVD